ncbi:MAG: dTMP kinase [Bdellovibrionales bacterium]|jgi:dTMP kinase|nr:dTMP kinase [Bdellovibrionales bacterium]
MQSRGRFLSFEGLDGSGKSTLIQNVKAALEKRGVKVRVTREPGGTPLAEDIRHLILRKPDQTAQPGRTVQMDAPVAATEILLYEASRAQHVAQVIRPALERGEWVLCDRFSESTVAFQCFARGLDRGEVDRLNRFAEQGVRPELVVLLDLTVEVSRRRQSGRASHDASSAPDRIESEADDFHERVRQGFLAQVAEEPARWVKLDADSAPGELLEGTMAELIRRDWLRA